MLQIVKMKIHQLIFGRQSIMFTILLIAIAGEFACGAIAGTETNLTGTDRLSIELRSLESTNRAWLKWNIALSNSEPQAVLVSAAAVKSMLCATTLKDRDGNSWQVVAFNGTNVLSTVGKDHFMLIRSHKTFETSIDTFGIEVKRAESDGADVMQNIVPVKYSIDALIDTIDFTSRQHCQRRCIGNGAVDLHAISQSK